MTASHSNQRPRAGTYDQLTKVPKRSIPFLKFLQSLRNGSLESQISENTHTHTHTHTHTPISHVYPTKDVNMSTCFLFTWFIHCSDGFWMWTVENWIHTVLNNREANWHAITKSGAVPHKSICGEGQLLVVYCLFFPILCRLLHGPKTCTQLAPLAAHLLVGQRSHWSTTQVHWSRL